MVRKYKVLRQTDDFVLEEAKAGEIFWITNRSQNDLSDGERLECCINRWNQGIGFEAEVEELIESETDALFNARCLMYFDYSPYEARGIYKVAA